MFNISYMDTEPGLIHQIIRAPHILNEYSLEQFYERVCADEKKLYQAISKFPKLPNAESFILLLDYLKEGKAYEMIISKLDSTIYPIEHRAFNNADYVILWQEASVPDNHPILRKYEIGTFYPRKVNNNPLIRGTMVGLAEWKVYSVITYTLCTRLQDVPVFDNSKAGTKDQIVTAAYRRTYNSITQSAYRNAMIPRPESFIEVGGKLKRVKQLIKRSTIKFDCIIKTYNDGIIQGFDWRVVDPNQYIDPNIELYCNKCEQLSTRHGFDMFYVETKGPTCGPCRDYYIENNLITESMVHR